MNDILFDFDDLLIEPARITNINSRKKTNPRYKDDFLPIMTAPMDTVINEKNFKIFKDNGIIPVLPRISNPDKNYVDTELFLSYSLDDFESIFLQSTPYIPVNKKVYALIDVANGHMVRLYEMAKNAKIKYGNSMHLMVGNVANPSTYYEYSLIGVDAVRIGIGNGNGCLTTVQTGVGYPMASLIEECRTIKNNNGFNTDIIADGGFKKYADIIKALGLGADFVMLGSILNKSLESAGETTKVYDTLGNHEIIDQYSKEAKEMYDAGIPLFKTFRGMSTKEVQKSWGKENITTSEGVVRKYNVEYTLKNWIDNFEDYLRSAMSYTNKLTLKEFIGNVNFNRITLNSFRRFDK
jgi:IMP dehydrogenase/GMP reductase